MKTIRLHAFLFTLLFFNSLNATDNLNHGSLFTEFEKGVVVFKNGVSTSALLNYNIIQQQMLFKDDDGRIRVIEKPLDILLISISDRHFLPVTSAGVFYEEIPAGKNSFFVQ